MRMSVLWLLVLKMMDAGLGPCPKAESQTECWKEKYSPWRVKIY
jgi:hypothetical protein